MIIQPGTDIGRYHILEQLGEGGMAFVYKAFDTRLENEVALKVIRSEKFTIENTDRALKRFQIEARKMANLTHPNIVPVIDYGEYEGGPYLVMRYLPGGTLKEKLGAPMNWREAVDLILPIAKALGYAHSEGLVHRDVKPSNILITKSGQPMLSDFGVAKVLEGEETLDLTVTGMGVGTPEYMAPEQAEGKSIDERADIYSLGVVFYELVTGHKPFEADTPMAVIIKQIHDPLPNPSQYVHELPQEVERVLFKALAKNPTDRYQSIAEMSKALAKLVHQANGEDPEKKLVDKKRISSQIEQKTVKEIRAASNEVDAKVYQSKRDRSNPRNWLIASITIAVLIIAVPKGVGKWQEIKKKTAEVVETVLVSSQTYVPEQEKISAIETQTAFLAAEKANEGILVTETSSYDEKELQAPLTPTETNEPTIGTCQIVYSSYEKPSFEIFIYDINGSNLRQLTKNDYRDEEPSLSPDRKQIIFSSNRDGDLELFTMNLDGSNLSQLTYNDSEDRYPSFSPDGNEIAFTSYADDDGEIYIMNVDGSNQCKLTDNDSNDYMPLWSPDGSQIAFFSNRDGDREIFIMDRNGNNQYQLTDNHSSESEPAWSPDGEYIAFVIDLLGDDYVWSDKELFRINSDGSNQRQMTNNVRIDDYSPSWSLDGTQIIFLRENEGGFSSRSAINSDGTNLHDLTMSEFEYLLTSGWCY